MGTSNMKRIAMAGAILLSSLVSFNTVTAAELSPEQQAAAATTSRQAVFKLLAFSNGVLGAMSRPGGTYDKDAAVLATQRVEMLANMIPALFAADTTALKHGGAPSRASDTIWGAKADFDMLAADLAAAAVAARGIIEAQGQAGLAEAVRTVGPKCGACHDRFRLE
jgi:cytochrome c556